MHVRVNTVRGVFDVENGVSHLREKVLPLLRQQTGYRGGMANVDQAGAIMGLITLWEDERALHRSEIVVSKSRAETVRLIGGDVTVDTFEQVVAEVGDPGPTPGCLVRFVVFEVDPARVDENVAFFRDHVLPAVMESEGFRAVRHLIDPASGRGLTALIVSDGKALTVAETGFEAGRAESQSHGVRFGEISDREVVSLDRR